MPLDETLSGYWQTIQCRLFPWLEEDFGPLGERHKQFVTVLELVRVFMAKAVIKRTLEDRLVGQHLPRRQVMSRIFCKLL